MATGNDIESVLDNGLVLRATAGHYVPIGGSTFLNAMPHKMQELSIGDKMWFLSINHDKPSVAYITAINVVQDEGHMSLHTASDHDGVVVDGVVAHKFTDHFPVRSVLVYKVVNTVPHMATTMLPISISGMVVSFLNVC